MQAVRWHTLIRLNTRVVPEYEITVPIGTVEVRYRFHAAALQTGSMTSGHYTSVARRQDKYIYFDDGNAEEVRFADWAAGRLWGGVDPRVAGYLFFYERVAETV